MIPDRSVGYNLQNNHAKLPIKMAKLEINVAWGNTMAKLNSLPQRPEGNPQAPVGDLAARNRAVAMLPCRLSRKDAPE